MTIAPNAAEMIAALGLADRLVGVSDFCTFPPSLADRPRVGGLMNPDLETIVLLKPDLVILRGNVPTVEALCAERGVEVYLDRTDTYDDVYANLATLGDRLDASDAADALARRMRADIAAVQARVADRPRPRVLMIVNRDADELRNVVTFGRGAFVNDVIRLAGGDNAFDDVAIPYPQVSIEQILAANPDVIVEAIEATKATDEFCATLLAQWKALPNISAVRSGRVHVLTEDYLLIPSPRVVDSVRRLACVFHPEVACD